MSSPSMQQSLLTVALGLMAAGAAHAAAPAASPSTPPKTQQLELASRQYAELQQMLALDARCQWLEPIARTAVEATAKERLAWFASEGGKVEQAQDAADKAIAREASLDCKSDRAATLAEAVRYAAWQMRVTWALRAEALLDTGNRPAWFKGKSSVASQRAVLQETAATLESRYGVSVKNARTGIQTEAAQLLAVRCTASDAGCRVENDSPAYRSYADEWIKQAEAYAIALAKAKDKIGTPPDVTPR